MKTTPNSFGAKGFSLIEVMVAVIVMSFGLLALSALQSALYRSGSESKAQSVALSLAKEKLEQLRAFNTYNEYLALTDSAAAESISIGGVTYSRTWTISRYGFNAGATTPAFQAVTSDTAALSSSFATNNEFKRVAVSVGWTDAQGTSRTLQVEDAVAAISPVDSARVAVEATGGAARKPTVIIQNPESVSGVIPIAIGDGSETAATNPRPTQTGVTSSNNNIETRFDVITYAALAGNLASAQARVETSVVGCRCNTNATGNIESAEKPQRPTYWNGTRYVVPKAAQSTTPVAGPASVANNNPQSPRCEACCRDHHDPTTEGIPKFDPRRTTHAHYKADGAVATSGQEYVESCRLIRVDGIWRVAQDFYADDNALVQTSYNGSVYAINPLPSELGKNRYESYVLDYLKQRFIDSGATINTPLSSSAVSALVSTHSLDVPSTITINAQNSEKWLHSRGLYVDWLEQEAIDAIATAKNNCTDGSDANTTLDAAEIQACVLKVLPFTSVNITELADWSSDNVNAITVLQTGFRSSTNVNSNTTPVRGRVNLVTGAANNATASGTNQIRASNTGIAVTPWSVDPDDATVRSDSQAFLVSNASSGGDQTGSFFKLTVGGTLPVAQYTGNNSVVAGFTIGTVGPQDCSHQELVDHDSNPNTPPQSVDPVGTYTCRLIQGQTIDQNTQFRVSDYNRQHSTGKSVDNGACKNGTTYMPFILDYDLASVSADGTVSSVSVTNEDKVGAGAAGEISTFSVNPVSQDDVIGLTFSGPTYLCPENWNLYITSSGTATSNGSGPTLNAWRDANCEGSGSTITPKWKTSAWVACPSGLTFP